MGVGKAEKRSQGLLQKLEEVGESLKAKTYLRGKKEYKSTVIPALSRGGQKIQSSRVFLGT